MPWEPGFSSSKSVPRLVVIVDVSGSVDDVLMQRFACEIEAIVRRLEAGLVLVVTLGWLGWSDDEAPVMRGGPSGAGQAQWLTAEPADHAQALATDLRALGAQVRVEADGSAWVLYIEAPAPMRAVIDGRLQVLDTALDAAGRLELRVLGN